MADGEWYRLVTSMFLHFGLLHIAFNMYALYLFGPLLEQLYGHIEYLIIYFLCGIGGSVMTILFAPEVRGGRRIRRDLRPLRPGVRGLAAAAPAARVRRRAPCCRRLAPCCVVNLVFTFAIPGISWTGHIGGLLVGGLIGLLLAPTNVPTMGGMWRAPDGRPVESTTPAVGAGRRRTCWSAASWRPGAFYAVNQVG